MGKIILKGTDLLDRILRKGFIIDLNTINRSFDESGYLIIQYQLCQVESDSHFQHSQTVNDVAP